MVRSGFQIALQRCTLIFLQCMYVGRPPREAANHHFACGGVEVGRLQEGNFTGPQSVAIGDEKQGSIPKIRDDGQELFQFPMRQDVDFGEPVLQGGRSIQLSFRVRQGVALLRTAEFSRLQILCSYGER